MTMDLVWAVAAACLMLKVSAQDSASTSPCSYMSFDEAACLQGIREVAYDTERYFFGKMPDQCQEADPDPIECYHFSNTTGQSIASLMAVNMNNIDRYLNVTFTSLPDSYEACDNVYRHTTTTHLVLDPVSQMRQESYHVRLMPNITWRADPDTLYTLVIKDVGATFMHGLYWNIPGNDIKAGDQILEYHGPRYGRNLTNPYAFMLFKQANMTRLQLNEAWFEIAYNPMTPFEVDFFQKDYSLIGPVAVNWIQATNDPYSVWESRMWLENCLPYVEEALKSHEITFMSEIPDLSAFMRVQFKNEEIEYEYCCTYHQYPEREFFVNPIGNGSVLPEETRTGNPVKVFVRMNKFNSWPAADFAGKMYTMLSVDVSLPLYKSGFGTRSRPLVHWMAINGGVDEDGMVQFESEVLEWSGPKPPDKGTHTYYFLLFEQKSGMLDLDLSDVVKYSGDECRDGPGGGKCLFDVDAFVGDHSLHMIAVSWMNANNTDFVNRTNNLEENKEVCGERYPCPSPPIAAGVDGVCVVNVLLLFVISIIGTIIKY